MSKKYLFLLATTFSVFFIAVLMISASKNEDVFLTYKVKAYSPDLKLYWKDTSGKQILNFENLKIIAESENKTLVFAMNGGMYDKDFSPKGLFIENGKTLTKLDKVQKAFGNFYLQPNGVFYLTNENKGVVCKTEEFENINVKFATQSGPMLLINGEMHPKFIKGSKNLNIRNGVGILPNGNILFVMSKQKINFYDFATYFKYKGCKNALYLDGYVSKTYLPEKNWIDSGGNFGVIVGMMKSKNL